MLVLRPEKKIKIFALLVLLRSTLLMSGLSERALNMFSEWLIKQFTSFNVLTMIVIVLFNYITTTRAVNNQMREQKLYEELEEIKHEIGRAATKKL